MSRVAVFDTHILASLVEILDASAGRCELVIVNAGSRPWQDEELAAFEGAADHVDGVPLTMAELCAELAGKHLDGVMTLSDHLLPLVARVAAQLGLPYHDETTAHALTRKDVQRRLLAAAGLDQPRTALIRRAGDIPAALEAVGFPAVLKPVHGAGSAGVFAINDADELTATLKSVAERPLTGVGTDAFTFDGTLPWQLEERMGEGRHPAGDWLGNYVSVETAALGPGRYWHFWITDRLPLTWPFRETGLVAPTLLPPDVQANVRDLASRALSALGVLTGLTHTEIKLTRDGPQVIEVNGRLGGFIGQLAGRLSDLDPTRLALEAALGQVVAPRPVVVAGGCEAVYLVFPPTWAKTLTRLPDPAGVCRIPGVWRVDSRTQPGGQVDYRSGTVGRVQAVWLRCSDPDDLAASCARIAAFVEAEVGYAPEATSRFG